MSENPIINNSWDCNDSNCEFCQDKKKEDDEK